MHLKSSQPMTAVLLACLHVCNAWAQAAPPIEHPSAEKPAALLYESSLQHYQRYSASTIQSWKDANDTVKDIGGWRAYAKENAKDSDARRPAPAPPHGGHQ